MNNQQNRLNRRGFLGTVSTGAAAIGLSMLTSPLDAAQKHHHPTGEPGNPDEWFNQIKGKHRMVFDESEPINAPVLPFAWPRVYLMTNQKTGTAANDCGVVVVLRHHAIIYALNDDQWKKYKFGAHYKLMDPETKAPLERNPFWQPKPGAFMLPGAGEVKLGIDQLMGDGVLFCVCNVALNVYSGITAMQMNKEHEEVKNDWVNGVLPGIQPVPSGVWAVNRAQEHGCSYCFGR